MPRRSHAIPLAALAAAVVLLLSASATRAAPPAVAYHRDLAAALKEARTLRVPALVVLTKPKASAPALADPRVARSSKALACASVPLTPALAKQYELDNEFHVLVLDPDGTVTDKFDTTAAAENLLAAINRQVDAARTELRKDLKPDSDAKAKKAALAGLVRLGPAAGDLVPLLTDPDATVKEAVRKALAALPPDATRTALLDALKSDDAAVRVAVHPLAVQATGYRGAPLKVWQTGTAEERAAAWDKWNDAVQSQFPPLNRAILAFCEYSLGAQVSNGECAELVADAFKECDARPVVTSGNTYVWGRALKPGEPVLPGDVVQFENVKFTNGAAPHHTAVVRKVLGPGKYETLEQNVNGVKKVQPGKLDMATVKEGSIVIYRPQPK